MVFFVSASVRGVNDNGGINNRIAIVAVPAPAFHSIGDGHLWTVPVTERLQPLNPREWFVNRRFDVMWFPCVPGGSCTGG